MPFYRTALLILPVYRFHRAFIAFSALDTASRAMICSTLFLEYTTAINFEPPIISAILFKNLKIVY